MLVQAAITALLIAYYQVLRVTLRFLHLISSQKR